MLSLRYSLLIKSLRFGEIEEIICPDLDNVEIYHSPILGTNQDHKNIKVLGEREYCARRLKEILIKKDLSLLPIPRPLPETHWEKLLDGPHYRLLTVNCPYSPKKFFFEKNLRWISVFVQIADSLIDLFFAFISFYVFSEGNSLAFPIIGLALGIFYDVVFFGASGILPAAEHLGRKLDDTFFRRENENMPIKRTLGSQICRGFKTLNSSTKEGLSKLYHQPKKQVPYVVFGLISVIAQIFSIISSYQGVMALSEQANQKLGSKWWLDSHFIKTLAIINVVLMFLTDLVYINLFSNMALPDLSQCCQRGERHTQDAEVELFSPIRTAQESKEEPFFTPYQPMLSPSP
ncbi:MAG: hypothetical protein K0Q57_1110 [Gammaproteobacteria bacterium]|nr:hypothetical protein [Gammaproteobacteria bacterium]